MKWDKDPGGRMFPKLEAGYKAFPKLEVGHKAFPKLEAGGISTKVRQRLTAMGMSQAGIQQLAAGQMPVAPGDRELVAQIVKHALDG